MVLILVFSFYTWYQDKEKFAPGADIRNFKTQGELDRYYKNLEKAYKNDTFGGATPEETLQLFIDALKAGDTELAAKYFIPEKQMEEKGKLDVSKNQGFIEKYIEILGGDKKVSKFPDGKTYEISFFDKIGNQIHVERLILNNFTKVWKIESL